MRRELQSGQNLSDLTDCGKDVVLCSVVTKQEMTDRSLGICG